MKKQEFLPAAFLKIWNLSFKSKHTPLLPLTDQHFCFGKNALGPRQTSKLPAQSSLPINGAAKLPFEDSAFNVVVSQFALMFFLDRVAALREMWRVLAPRGRLAVAVCAPITHTRGYSVLAGILRREAGHDAAAMVEGYFALGDQPELQQLCTAAGIGGVRVLTREGWARFASIDELVRIEIKGSPLAGPIDDANYQKVLKAVRQELREFCDAQGRVDRPDRRGRHRPRRRGQGEVRGDR